jgi:hypothetical protein
MPAGELAQAILASMKYVEAALLLVFERTANAPGLVPSEKQTAAQILRALDEARDAARRECVTLFQHMNEDAPNDDNVRAAVGTSGHPLFLVSLIEVCFQFPKVPGTKNEDTLLRWLTKCVARC